MKKVRVIKVSSALPAHKAESFRKHFKDLFDGKYVFAGLYLANGSGDRYPCYYVVRVPKKDEPQIEGFEMMCYSKELLSVIMTRKIEHRVGTRVKET